MSRTPEDVARDIMQHAVVADEEAWIAYAAEVIALDRAEAKAEALAGFTEEWTVAATDWIEEAGHDRSREAAERKLRTSPKPAWLERRLVGPWEPAP